MSFRYAIGFSSRLLKQSKGSQFMVVKACPGECLIATASARLQSTGTSQYAPVKPKRAPLSAYQFFVKDKLTKKLAVDESQTNLLRKVAVEWQSLSEEEKEPYRDRSDIEKDNWYKECAEYEKYLDSLSEVQRTRIKLKELLLKADSKARRKLSKNAADDIASKMPKRPGSIFQMFIAQEMQAGTFKGMKGPELFHAAGVKWKTISEEQKDDLREQRQELQEKYLKDLDVWKNN